MKRKISNRFLALLLTLALMIGLFPSVIQAADGPAEEEAAYPYLDTNLSAEERAVDLVSRMTLEEKCAQLGQDAPAIARLGVRAYNWWSEALHGITHDGAATSFPTGLGIASTWDVDLVQSMMQASADEARSKFNSNQSSHGLNYWSPTINMNRDPRWGRSEETYGEDPYLTGHIAEAFIEGLQDVAEDGTYKTIATAKHFLANNSETNRHIGSSNLTERDLREYYTPAFKYAVEEAGVGAIMTSYNAVNGVPMSMNEEILDGILRRTWGFDGFVVTDCGALSDILKNHYSWRPDSWKRNWTAPAVSAYATNAGVDLGCRGMNASDTSTAVNTGLLSEGAVDRALVRLFTARIQTGEFDPDGGTYGGNQFQDAIQSEAHVQLAEEAADSAVTLLKNDGILPLKGEELSNVVLVGDRADEIILGDYSTKEPQNTSTPLAGITAALKRANPNATLTYVSTEDNVDQYLMNTKSVRLLSETNETVAEFPLKQNSGLTGCKIENAGNIGYASSDGCWVKFAPGSISFDGATKFSAEMSGTENISATRLEIHAQSPTGPLLGTLDGVGNTGGWSNYVTYYGTLMAGGGYTDEELYLVFSVAPQEGIFTSEQQQLIKDADAVIYYAGTKPGENGYAEESDGYDLNLLTNQADEIEAISGYTDNLIIYMQTASQINVEPFKEKAKAILWSTFNGQAQGNAAGRILFGEVNPSGKLPFTWYTDVNELADIKDYTMHAGEGNNGRTYQYFTGDVTYPFGYGLSYTQFKYSNLQIDLPFVLPDDTVTVSVDVENTGTVKGKEVVQMYVVSPDAAKKDRPAKRLEGFDKIELEPGEKQTVKLTLPVADLWFWDDAKDVQTYDQGVYTVQVGGDSKSCEALSGYFVLSGTLTPVLHTVTAIPSGHILDLSKEDAKITTKLTASYNDQSFVDLSQATVKYESSDDAVAEVSQDGTVTGTGNGIATITASVTVGDVTLKDSFAVKTIRDPSQLLSAIQLDGRPLAGFSPSTMSYEVVLTSMEKLPVITETHRDPSAKVEIVQPTAEEPKATVTIDVKGTKTVYTLYFGLAPKSYDFRVISKEDLLAEWEVIRQDDSLWRLEYGKGLVLTTHNGDIINKNQTAKDIFLQPGTGDWVAETKITFSALPTQNYQQAGMIIYQDDDNYLKVDYERAGNSQMVQLSSEIEGTYSATTHASGVVSRELYLRIERVCDQYTVFYSTNGKEYKQLGIGRAPFIVPRIGLFANSSTQDTPPIDATFAYFRVGDAPAVGPFEVMELIDAIGEVSLDSADEIQAARDAYDALEDAQKTQVANYQTLLDAEQAYAVLLAQDCAAKAQEALTAAQAAAEAAKNAQAAADDAAKSTAADKTAAEAAQKAAQDAQTAAKNAQDAAEKAAQAAKDSDTAAAAKAAAAADDAAKAAKSAADAATAQAAAQAAQGKAEDAQKAAEAAQAKADEAASRGEGFAEEAAAAQKAAADAKTAAENAKAAAEAAKAAADASNTAAAQSAADAAASAAQAADALKQVAEAQIKVAEDRAAAEAAAKAAQEAELSAARYLARMQLTVTLAGFDTTELPEEQAEQLAKLLIDASSKIDAAKSSDEIDKVMVDTLAAIAELLDGICPSAKFTDVPAEDNWAHEGIDYCVAAGLMDGVGADKFNPSGTLTRAQLVTILYRLTDEPDVTTEGTFSDVPAGQWYTDAIEWAAANKIVDGVGEGKFNPSGAITREQIATILYRYSDSPAVTGDLSKYPDNASVSSYATDAMVWATSEGLINGVGSGSTANLAPKNSATRAQIAAIIMRLATTAK